MTDDNSEGSIKDLENLYTQGKFSQAIDIMLKNKSSFPKGVFHYNLGTLYAKEGSFAAGRYHLEKAIAKNFVNSMSLNNLETVQEKLAVNDISNSASFHDRFVDRSLLLPSEIYLSATLLLALAFMALIKWKKIVAPSARWGLMLLTLVPLAYNQLYLRNINHAIVLQDTQMYDGPSKIYFNTGIVKAGSKIITGKNNNGWYLIQSPLQLSGWVYQDSLGFY